MRRWFGRLAICGLLAAATASHSQDIPGYPASVQAFDSREVAMLPAYCRYTIYFRDKVPGGSNATEMTRWRDYFGPTFGTLHHHCFGIMKTNRAVLLAREALTKQFYLTDSLLEFDYVLERAPADFVLLPELLTKKGANLVLLNRGPEAVVHFERAIEARPDYWPAYGELSDFFRAVREPEKAREVLERGLAAAPNTPALERRLSELDKARGERRPQAAGTATPASSR